MAEEKSASKGAKRPWQATTLGVLDSIGAVMCLLFSILAFFMKGMLETLLSGSMDMSMSTMEGVDENAVEAVGFAGDIVASLGSALGVFFLVIAALSFFMARAVFKGQKWSPILTIIFTVLGVLGMAMNFDQSQIGSLVFNLFVVYICIMSIRSPYFNKG